MRSNVVNRILLARKNRVKRITLYVYTIVVAVCFLNLAVFWVVLSQDGNPISHNALPVLPDVLSAMRNIYLPWKVRVGLHL